MRNMTRCGGRRGPGAGGRRSYSRRSKSRSKSVQISGYIDRQAAKIERNESHENTRLPESLDYAEVRGLSFEARQKLDAASSRDHRTSLANLGHYAGRDFPADGAPQAWPRPTRHDEQRRHRQRITRRRSSDGPVSRRVRPRRSSATSRRRRRANWGSALSDATHATSCSTTWRCSASGTPSTT